MRVLVACEYSGVVRDAFRKKGHEAWSCDIIPSDIPSKYHIQDDVLNWLNSCSPDCVIPWDLMIAHPPCTHLAVSGAKWFKDKKEVQDEALEFVKQLLNAPIDRICLENPVSIISTRIRRPDQIIQPWMFGHPESKKTCLWLKNLPKLQSTNIVTPEEPVTLRSGKRIPKWYSNAKFKDRSKIRSRTFEGIAKAMAEQWG